MTLKERIAMNIVHQLADLWKVDVETRQKTNDKCYEFVEKLIREQMAEAFEVGWEARTARMFNRSASVLNPYKEKQNEQTRFN